MRTRARSLATLAGVALLTAWGVRSLPQAARGADVSCKLPVHAVVDFHLTAAASSNESKTGDAFGFVLLRPIAAPGCDIPADGSVGAGTILLAGPSGNLGHEGDLTLRLDTLRTADGRLVAFDDQEIKLQGADRKTESAILRLVPDAGAGAGAIFIHGKNIHIAPDTPLETQLTWPASVASAPQPSASGS